MARGRLGCWIEAMRLRTLPVSAAGVLFAAGVGGLTWHFAAVPFALALVFALLAQIASNFANEYYDYRDGLDRPGREGPRRGVTEGDITPVAMKRACFGTLLVACCVGLTLVALYGKGWMYAAGVAIALGAMAYSAGPYPLSRHALGEVAVVLFFGIAPVCLTCMLMGGPWSWWIFAASVGVGLMGANVLVVNNMRDIPDDKAVGKTTLAVLLGRRGTVWLYLINGIVALLLTLPMWLAMARLGWIAPVCYLAGHLSLTMRISHTEGRALNPALGMTSMLMFVYALAFAAAALLPAVW